MTAGKKVIKSVVKEIRRFFDKSVEAERDEKDQAIEQDADVVMFIYRKVTDRAQVCPEEEKNLAEIHVAKHRNGPTGVVQLFFDEDRVSFKSMAQQFQTAPVEQV